jgi:hypothetical protein
MTQELQIPEIGSLCDQAVLADDIVDDIERAMIERGGSVNGEQFPVVHRFVPGMYIREIHMPAGSVLTSKIHKTEHPFVIMKGVVSVWSLNEGSVLYRAPYFGITEPGTRRVLMVHEDTVWITFHVGEEETVEEVEDRIIEKRHNPRIQTALDRRNLVCLGQQ